jgi:hypothetical protein
MQNNYYQSPLSNPLNSPGSRALRRRCALLAIFWAGILGLCVGVLSWHLQLLISAPDLFQIDWRVYVSSGFLFASAGMVCTYTRYIE